MATLSARRSAAVAVAAVAATIASPLTGAASAAAFAATGITTQPKPDSSNVVAANRPTVIASFNANLANTSSITLTVKGDSTNLCNAFTVKDKDVSCAPTADLDKSKTYVAVGHGVSTSGAKADTKPLEFTVDYPAFEGDKSTPIAGGSVIDGSETLTAQFDEPVVADKNVPGFRVFEYSSTSGRGDEIPGTVSYGGNPLTGSDGTVSYKANAPLQPGGYEAVVFVHGDDGSGGPAPDALGTADYRFWVDNTAPSQLLVGNCFFNGQDGKCYANNQNSPKMQFTGVAAPGLTVKVTVPNSSTSPLASDATGSALVQPCGTAPSCPWKVTVDISGNDDNSNQSWSAQASDSSGATTPSSEGGHFTKDTTKPDAPTVSPTPTISDDSRTVTLGATDASTDVGAYVVTITDPEGNSIAPTYPAVNHNLPTQTIDVTGLDDGTLSIIVQAQDNAGNLSDAQSSPFKVKKDQGVFPNLNTSTLSTPAGDTTFLEAEGHAVQPPSKVTLRFTQPIKASRTVGFPQQTEKSSMYISTPNGNLAVGGTVKFTDDGRGMTLDVPKDKLVDGHTYGIHAVALSKNNCPNGSTSDPNPPCDKFQGVVKDLATGHNFTFTIDNTPPTVAVTKISPDPIGPDDVGSVSVSGTVSPDARTVQLAITSSGGKGTRVASATVTPPSSAGSPATWSADGLDLSAIPDGHLTVLAKATDEVGLVGRAKGKATLAAHVSTLTARVDDHRVKYRKAVTVSGRLTDEHGDPIADATISVEPKFDNGRRGAAQNALTDDHGRWSLVETPKQNSKFIATYAGSTTSPIHDAAKDGARTYVHAFLKFTKPGKGDSVGHNVRVKGKVKPNKKHEKVRIYLKTGHGKKLLGTDRLNKHSRWSLKVHLPAGKDRLIAKIGKTEGNLGGRSATLTLRAG